MYIKLTWIKILLIVFLILALIQSSYSQNQNEKLTYLALGDSYTIGESVEVSERWPVQLVEKLNQKGLAFEDPVIVAKTGWTTDELDKGIHGRNIEGQYDLVSLLIGVNNQYRGRSVKNFRSEFVSLLQRSLEFVGNRKDHVFVLSIPDWGVTPFARNRDKKKIAKEIDSYNSVVKEECEKMGIVFFDITPISREAIQDKTLLAPDGLHPSGKMYGLWVDEVLGFVSSRSWD